MAEALKKVFTDKNAKGLPAFVTFLTAGFPQLGSAVPLMLALQKGGADVIELGIPFSDPMADGVAIQHSNNIALQNGMDYRTALDQVKEARSLGLTTPVVLMGYYNPVLSYGEELAVQHAREAGANGFIVVDLPPEEAVRFREVCTKEGLSYVPLIAPSTTDARIKFLSSIADSFIYVVSKMGVTGSTANGVVSTSLPAQIKRIRKFTSAPLAVGFGVATAAHFDTVAQSGASGVVIGSRIVGVIGDAKGSEEERASAVETYCREVSSGAGKNPRVAAEEPSEEVLDKLVKEAEPELAAIPVVASDGHGDTLPSRFGDFGGQYVAEALVDSLVELEMAHKSALADPSFWKEFEGLYGYINRPSQLYEATRLTEHAGGAKIWLKREDLNHTGSHKINNALGQILLARRLGKTCIIAETGAGQHGVATATACAKFGMKCKIYMGAEDVRRQALNVFRIKMLGAEVVPVTSGSQTLKDAINEAMRDWVVDLPTTHYCVGSAIGPHPFPTIVRDFQRVIGKETKQQLMALKGKLPDAVVACVGGGSNAMGMFFDFIPETSVRLIGVEAGGDGVDTDRHSATLSLGVPGVLHGVKTYLLQSKTGQIIETHSISPGLDYPGVGPEHSWLKDTKRAEYIVANDEEALRAFRLCTQLEGIIPALESAHAIHGAVALARTLPKDQDIVVCLSGRGDKDVQEVFQILPAWAEKLDWKI